MAGTSTLKIDWLGALCEEVPHRLGMGVAVWRVELPAHIVVPDRLVGVQERARATRLGDPFERLRHTASYAVLRSVLSALHGYRADRIEFVRDERGKPRLPGDGLRFNLSRSGAALLIGVCESLEIGVDVEWVREVPDLEGLARNHFSAAEYEVWKRGGASAPNLSFLHGWTRKEACVKAAGMGLALPLAHVDVGCEASEIPREIVLNRGGACWAARVVSLPMPPNCVAAAAVIE
jgi:4'-phosphopantetheinyl transferase